MKIEDILEKKNIIEKKNEEKTAELEIKSLKDIGDGKITIKSLSRKEIDEIRRLAKTEEDANIIGVYKACVEPNLKDKEFQKALGCRPNSYDIVEKLFTLPEIIHISDEIAVISNLEDSADLVKKVKN